MTLMKHATVWSFEINLRRPGPSVASSFRMIYNITQFNLRCSVIGSGRVMLFRPKTDNWRVWKRVSERAASSHLGHSTNCAKSRIHHDERKKHQRALINRFDTSSKLMFLSLPSLTRVLQIPGLWNAIRSHRSRKKTHSTSLKRRVKDLRRHAKSSIGIAINRFIYFKCNSYVHAASARSTRCGEKNHFDVTSIDRIRIWMPQKKRFSLHCKAFCPSSLLGFSAVCQLQGVLMMILSVMISDAINLAFLKAKRHNIRKSISVNGKFDKFWFVNVGLGPWPAQQPERRRRRVNYEYWLHAQHMTLVYKLQSFFLASTQQFHNILLFNDYFYFIKLNK